MVGAGTPGPEPTVIAPARGPGRAEAIGSAPRERGSRAHRGACACGTLPIVRAPRLAPRLLPASFPAAGLACLLLALPGCPSEEPGGIEASVARAQIDVNPAQPDALATLDVTVELQTAGQPEDVELGEVTITAQPVTDDSERMTFAAEMMNPQGDDPVVRLAAGEEISVRILNMGTTNGELAAWCRLPVELAVTMETADGEDATATFNATVRCP